MNEVISRRHPLNFYLTLFFAVIFYGGLGSVLPFIQKKKDPGFMFFVIVLSVLFVFIGIYTIIKYFQNAPKIKISQKQIIFNTIIYSIEDIENVQFTGKQPFPYLITFYREGAEILFKNGDTKYIFDDMYSNPDSLKLALESFFKKNEPFQAQQNEKSYIENEEFAYFRGNPFLNSRTVILVFITAAFIASLLKSQLTGILISTLGAGLFFYMITVQFFYFGISKNYFIVRNHWLIWHRKIYPINLIREITFEAYGKSPNILRVTTKTFESKKYPASTLTDKKWLNLKEVLERHGILVKNECIIDNNEL